MLDSAADHLLHVPNAQPPLPSDWEVHPTHPVHAFSYYLAPLWDQRYRQRAEEVAAGKRKDAERRAGFQEQKGRVPQELRQKLKKSKGAKSLLQELEEEIRTFLKEWERENRAKSESEMEIDSDEEEIVFIGRNRMSEQQLLRERLIFDSLADDQAASFG